jgi:hypothetical protein
MALFFRAVRNNIAENTEAIRESKRRKSPVPN